jgi:SnoaL-like polyketide cyclase
MRSPMPGSVGHKEPAAYEEPAAHKEDVMELDDKVIAQALRSVEHDLVAGFEGVLEAREFTRDLHGADLEHGRLFATSADLVVVPWVWRAVHVGEFLGVPPTYVELELRGTTFVHVSASKDETDWAYYRYVDYLGALHQLGVTVSRPALTSDEYAAWTSRRD